MKIYHGKILNSAIYMVIKLALIGVITWVIMVIATFALNIDFRLTFNFDHIIIALIILSVLILMYAISVNNDIIITEGQIIIRKRLIFYKKEKAIPFEQIKMIRLKHDWTETVAQELKPSILKYIYVEWILKVIFPTDYKWIEIKTHNDTHRYFCFGLEYDYYDNPRPHFDDLYFDLAKHGINVEWTNDTDPYYKELRKTKEELIKEYKAKSLTDSNR